MFFLYDNLFLCSKLICFTGCNNVVNFGSMLFLLCRDEKANIQSVSGTPKVSEPLRYWLVLGRSLIRFSAGSLDILRLPLGSFDVFQANTGVVLPTRQKKSFLQNSFKSPFICYSSNRHIQFYSSLS